MTLTTHAVVGATAAVATTSILGATPTGLVLGFAAGFASHFVIDAIPHWQEGVALLRSTTIEGNDRLSRDMTLGKDFIHDLFVLAADALLGLALSVLIFSVVFFHAPFYVVLLGVVAGQLPDALQFVYFKTRLHLMTPLQTFHSKIQTELKNPLFLGIELVLLVVLVVTLKIFVY